MILSPFILELEILVIFYIIFYVIHIVCYSFSNRGLRNPGLKVDGNLQARIEGGGVPWVRWRGLQSQQGKGRVGENCLEYIWLTLAIFC